VGVCQRYMESSGLSCKDSQDRDHWRLNVNSRLADPGLCGKWSLKLCLFVYIYICVSEVVTMVLVSGNTRY